MERESNSNDNNAGQDLYDAYDSKFFTIGGVMDLKDLKRFHRMAFRITRGCLFFIPKQVDREVDADGIYTQSTLNKICPSVNQQIRLNSSDV